MHQGSGWPQPALEVRACEPRAGAACRGGAPSAGGARCAGSTRKGRVRAPLALTAPSGPHFTGRSPGQHGGQLTARAGAGHTAVPCRAAWLAGA